MNEHPIPWLQKVSVFFSFRISKASCILQRVSLQSWKRSMQRKLFAANRCHQNFFASAIHTIKRLLLLNRKVPANRSNRRSQSRSRQERCRRRHDQHKRHEMPLTAWTTYQNRCGMKHSLWPLRRKSLIAFLFQLSRLLTGFFQSLAGIMPPRLPLRI